MGPGAGSAPGALVTAGDDWRAVLAAQDRVIAAQAATIGAQAQTIAALLSARSVPEAQPAALVVCQC